MHRPLLLVATIVLAAGAAFSVLLLAYATGLLYIDDPDPDPPLARGWFWAAALTAVLGTAAALAGVARDDRVWAVGAAVLAALTALAPVLLGTA